jgi:LuxR family maltose regulon positive regulatory protein
VTARSGPLGDATLREDARDRVAGRRPSGSMSAKFSPPLAHLELVQRRSLLSRLASTVEPLVLCCAPAGAGKTVALRQWIEADPRPATWLRLEPGDDDPVVLLQMLARALGGVAEVDPAVTAYLELEVPPLRERVLPLLADALAQADPFILVLDDAQALTRDRSWDVIAFVLRDLPRHAQMAIGARVDPQLPLARLRADGELAEYHLQDFAFDRDETVELLTLHACCDASDDVVDALLVGTEGWAAGLRLACAASCQLPVERWLPQAPAGRREIAEYLTSEVLEQQPEQVQDFLLSTSVLRVLTPSACRLATGMDDASDLLERIARDELFVVPLGDSGSQYRYHHLFAEVLSAELERRRPGGLQELHRRIGTWCAEHGDPDDAVYHLLAGGDVAAAGDIVAASWRSLWNRGQAETVCRWLESFDDRQILSHKALTLTAGWVYTALDAGALGARWGSAACSAPMTDEPSPDGATSLRSSQALLRATVAPDGVGRMREDAELAAQLETSVGSSWHADSQVALGVARWLSESSQRALHPLALGAREGAMYNSSAELAALGYLSLIAIEEEEWETAEEYEARASARLAELGFGTNRRCLPMLLARTALLARDPHADAEAAAAEVHRLLEHMVPHPWMALLTHTVLGEVALERSDAIEAEAHAAAAGALLKRYPDAGVLRARAERLRRAVEGAHAAEPLTGAEHKVLALLPTHFTEAQIAEQLYVSRNTVKTHLRSVYRKLGTSTRAEAVQRARDIGLLPQG